MELDNVVGFFDEHVRQHAKPSEETQFDNAVRSARRAIELNDSSFENYLDDLRGKHFDILWRQDLFVDHRFQWLLKSPPLFPDHAQFRHLGTMDQQASAADVMQKLREVVAMMSSVRTYIGGDAGCRLAEHKVVESRLRRDNENDNSACESEVGEVR